MSKNLSNIIFESVSKTNTNRYNITRHVLEEDSYEMSPKYDSAQSFYGKARIDRDNDEIILKSYNVPIIKVKDGNFEVLCKKEDLTNTTMRHVRDFLKQMVEEKKLNIPEVEKITRQWVVEHMNKPMEEEVHIENNSQDSGKKVPIHNEVSTEEVVKMFRQMVKDNPNNEKAKEFLKKYDPEYKMEESAKVLTEAPEDEEFEVNEEELTDTEMSPDEEMSDEEVQDEVVEDEKEVIEDEIEQPFYATNEAFDELRDLLVDLDYRLFLINGKMVCIGRLNGPDIEFLTSNRPENVDMEVSEQNEKSEEVKEKAEDKDEPSFEYMWIKAPDSFDKFLNQVNVVYLSPDLTDEEKEQFAGNEASHESVMNYLMNELPEDKKEEVEEEIEEDQLPEETPEEPIEDKESEEIDVEEEE